MSRLTSFGRGTRLQRVLTERILLAAVAGNQEEAESTFEQLTKIGGTQALFNAVLSWANFAVDASDKSMATVAYSCKLLLEANPVPSEDTTAEDLEDAALFLSAVIHDDAEGALFLWQTMPEGRCGFVAGIVLGMATEAYCLNHPEEA